MKVEVDTVTPESWDRAASNFLDISYDQTARFSDAWQGTKRSSHILLRNDNDEAIAGARLIIFTPGFGSGVAFCRGGPFLRRREPADPNAFHAITTAMKNEYCKHRKHVLTMLPSSSPDAFDMQQDIMQASGFIVRRPVFMGRHFYVNAALSEDARLRSLSKQWRYNLRVALRSDIAITLSQSPESLAVFSELHAAMLLRKRLFNIHDRLDVLPELWKLPLSLRPYVVMGSHQGRPVCGAIVAVFGDTALHAFGASDKASLPIQASYGLHWWILNWLSNQGIRWYNLGSDGSDQGLHQYKTGFVGKTGRVIEQGEYDFWPSERSRLVGDSIYRVRELRRHGRSAMARMRNWMSRCA
jgi:hypothetical protein